MSSDSACGAVPDSRGRDDAAAKLLETAIAAALAETATEWGSSRFAQHRRCQQAHDLRYRLKVMPQARALHFGVGTLVHAGLRYTSEGVIAGEPQPRDWRLLIDAASRRLEFTPEACDEASRLLHWYFDFWGQENAGWPEGVKIVACEREFSDSESFALPYTARADAILEYEGRIIVVDTKTRKSSLPEDRAAYARKLATRPQFLGLSYLVMRELGLEAPPDVWVNALCKLKVPKFGRVLVPFAHSAIDLWCDTQKQLAEAGLHGTLRNYDACAPEIGSECEYFEWCHGSDEARALHYAKG